MTVKAAKALLFCYMLLSSCATASGEDSGQCKNLTREQIAAAVDHELKRKFGDDDRPQRRKIDIWRTGCDYYYFEDEVPWSPGAGFGMRINQDGKVVEFIPAL